MNQPDESFDRDVDDLEPANLDSDSEESYRPMDEVLNAKTLYAAYQSSTKT